MMFAMAIKGQERQRARTNVLWRTSSPSMKASDERVTAGGWRLCQATRPYPTSSTTPSSMPPANPVVVSVRTSFLSFCLALCFLFFSITSKGRNLNSASLYSLQSSFHHRLFWRQCACAQTLTPYQLFFCPYLFLQITVVLLEEQHFRVDNCAIGAYIHLPWSEFLCGGMVNSLLPREYFTLLPLYFRAGCPDNGCRDGVTDLAGIATYSVENWGRIPGVLLYAHII